MQLIKSILLLFLMLLCMYSCDQKEALFVQRSASETGIDFSNKLTNTPDLNILTYLYFYNGSGVSAADFNNDGLTDLYFTANQTADKLFLNKGNFTFDDITMTSGIDNADNWTTGSTTVDINNDGLLDIYVCKIGSYLGIDGENLLYVNQGVVDGRPTFKEEASKYGLNFKGFSTQAAFFDYDLDGDLDVFLLNHSVHPNRNYGKGIRRLEKDPLSGDKLFENRDSQYVDVTDKAGIFQGKIGYGLGLAISDVNNDGFPDIYVGNDFFENDYLYINQKDKTFKELISSDVSRLGHTSHFSMGNVISDLNNDGHYDIFSLDMLPEDLKTYKTSGLEFPYQTYEYYLKNGYAPQYMQNTLHQNLGNENFSEIAHQSGIAATEWSWSPLAADFNNDGYKDLYITNGILGATNDMDFINFISNEKLQKKISQGMTAQDLAFINEMPKKKTSNIFYKNLGGNTFVDQTGIWFNEIETYSNGATYADLDNDGDLDLVVNNVNEPALVLENLNQKLKKTNGYLKINFKGPSKNIFGVGARINVYVDGKLISEDNAITKGYLSSISPQLHLGLGKVATIDSLKVIWPGGAYQTLIDISVNKLISLEFKNARGNYYEPSKKMARGSLNNVDSFIDFKHNDLPTLEFNRDPLIPYASTNLGPGIAVEDVNNDGLDDLFICGAKTQASQLFIQQQDTKFVSIQQELFLADAMSEDVDCIFFDANNDGFKDLLVVSGGNEFTNGKPLQPRLYFNNKGNYIKDSLQFKDLFINASTVKAVDIDNDGDLDLSIFSNLLPRQFGATPKQYIYANDGKGIFKDISKTFGAELEEFGNIYDAQWEDINNDSLKDLIIAGHWMPISIFLNNGKTLALQKNNGLANTNGWYNTLKAHDFDGDGDLDLVAGNWGLNTRLSASKREPLTLYSHDFDANGSVEPVVSYFYKGIETPFASKDELVKQLPYLNKEYLSYSAFAQADFIDLFGKKNIANSKKKYVYELASMYFENQGNGNFIKKQLPFMAQISSVFDIAVDDFNDDGFFDILLTGNNYEISTQLGRFDASHGLLLLNDKNGYFILAVQQDFNIPGPARKVKPIEIGGQKYYVITINNAAPVFLGMNNK